MYWRCEINDDIATLWVDVPDAKVNTFSTPMMAAFEQHLDDLAGREDLRALLLRSGKPRTFIAGADIGELAAINSIAEALAKAERGQAVFNKLAALPMPTIAVIHGPCLGGGLECALACDYRLVVDDPKTRLGLPEVQLGIIPGWGGTQRLPRLIGLDRATPLILTGKLLPAQKAYKLGLADALLSDGLIADGITAFLQRLQNDSERQAIATRRRSRGLLSSVLTRNPLGRLLFFRQAGKQVQERTKGHYPAPIAALAALKASSGRLLNGLRREAALFAPLAVSPVSRHLVHLFFNNESLKRIGDKSATGLSQTAVLGAGIMGGGIAWLLAKGGCQVRLRDLAWEPIAKALQTAKGNFDELKKRKKMTEAEVGNAMLRIGGSTSLIGLGKSQIVIEAVVEKLLVKQQVLGEIESVVADDCIIASNTSSLTVAAMATALERPERFAGLHFFNPVHRMPLVEVVPGPQTDPAVADRLCGWCRDLGKTPIIVGDCPGFLVNRLLLPFMNEAAWLLQDGADPALVDRVLMDFGMPMGAFRLADEVGLDVGYKVAAILADAYGERMAVAPILKVLAEDQGLLGRKGGTGFYRYVKGKSAGLNPALTSLLSRDQGNAVGADSIRDRCLLIMINEASRCLAEGVIENPDHLDMALILGTGFPPHQGGLLRWAEGYGLTRAVERLDELSRTVGPRFAPTDFLTDLAREGGLFHGHIHVPPAA